MCSVCHPCQAAITPGYPATLRSQLEFAGGTVSVNSSSSPRAKHPPAPCSLAASSPSSSLQKTKGTSPRPGPLPSSKLGASDQSVPQSQSKPRQAQVALSAPQLTAASFATTGQPGPASHKDLPFTTSAWPEPTEGTRPAEGNSKDAGCRLFPRPAVAQSQTHQTRTHATLPGLSIASGAVQDRQPSCSQRLHGPETGLMFSARSSRGEQQGEMLIKMQG